MPGSKVHLVLGSQSGALGVRGGKSWGLGRGEAECVTPFPGEAERQQLSEVAQQLERELQRTQESLASVGLQLEAARQGQQESTEEAASLRQELTQQQELYGQGVREGKGETGCLGGWAGPRSTSPPHTPLHLHPSSAREGG